LDKRSTRFNLIHATKLRSSVALERSDRRAPRAWGDVWVWLMDVAA
jgi:hypothetical protein